MAETTHLSRRHLRGDFPSLSALPGLRAFRHCATRSPDCARRAANAVHSRDRSQLESARAGDRLALLSGRDLVRLYESLPSADVRITAYNQSARQLSIDGEANTAALAYQFAEKIKKN